VLDILYSAFHFALGFVQLAFALELLVTRESACGLLDIALKPCR
jgi:hypothetical protein